MEKEGHRCSYLGLLTHVRLNLARRRRKLANPGAARGIVDISLVDITSTPMRNQNFYEARRRNESKKMSSVNNKHGLGNI